MNNKKSWSSYYESRVNNDQYLLAFDKKYSMFLNEIISKCNNIVAKSRVPIILKEEGCGIGTISRIFALSKLYNVPTKKVIHSDISHEMISLCYINTSRWWEYNKQLFYIIEDITKRKFYEPNTVVVTHGVLEHFSDEDIQKIMDTYDTDKVIFQAHYVPTIGYTEKSFGDERLLSIAKWIDLVKPDYWLVDNMGNDLYLFKIRKKGE